MYLIHINNLGMHTVFGENFEELIYIYIYIYCRDNI